MKAGDQQWGLVPHPGGVAASIWAPSAHEVSVAVEGRPAVPMQALGGGWFRAEVLGAQPGDRYRLLADGKPVPDPASRFQPEGAEGPSEIVDTDAYAWRCTDWAGRPWAETVLYELHVGTFSAAGTFLGAIPHLDHLAALGVTMVELMPVATCPGRRNWGYDGVLLFAPDRSYGSPEDLKRLIDECHLRGMSIILDVVYNHFGPLENWLHHYAGSFFTDRHATPWGPGINFDGEGASAVRGFYAQNMRQWLHDYRFDGLRLDAVQAIVDGSTPHILDELATRARADAPGRLLHLTLENDHNEARWLEGAPAGYDGQWNDDFHHVLRVLMTGDADGYYEDYADDPADYLGRALTQGFSYQGQEAKHRPGMMRGTPSGHLPPTSFINFIQNHDQIGNSLYGQRLTRLASTDAVRLGTAVLLLSPGIPMLFMGQEWASDRPFDFFCDYQEPLAGQVRDGRRGEFKRFKAFQTEEVLAKLADPNAASTRDASVLDWDAVGTAPHAEWLAFHRELLRVRREVVVPLLGGMGGGAGSYRVLEPGAVEASWAVGGSILRMTVNFSDNALADSAYMADPVFRLGPVLPGQVPPWGLVLTVMPA